MPKRSLHPGDNKKIEQLNQAVEAMFARKDGRPPKVEVGIEPLLKIAADLRDLPRSSFKARLKSDLEGKKRMSAIAEPITTPSTAAVRISASPRMAFRDPAKAIEFYKRALGAKEVFRFQIGNSIPHAELMIGDSTIDVTGEWPEGGRFSAETLGNSPISISVEVPNVDAFAKHAVAEGMKLVREPKDQFYGHRDATLQDPFGYSWGVYTVKEEMSAEEMHRRMQGMSKGPEGGALPQRKEKKPGVSPIPAGYHTVTPYLVAQDADVVTDFVKKTFGGEETFRAVGSAGGYHCEIRVEDSMLMIGGGGAGLSWKGESMPGAFHVYVRDCDATYQQALQAGAKSIAEPADQFYGERSASVVDAAGNYWYIATRQGENYKVEGFTTVQACLHPLRAEPVINFLQRAFGAQETGRRHTSPDGVIHHTIVTIGDSTLELGEAHGPYQPLKSMFYMYVPNVDDTYKTAIAAGAKSLHEPANQPYGDRVGAVTDVFGNQWWIATHVKGVQQ